MRFSEVALVALASLASNVSALSPAGWRSQSIYQVLTDRFARTDGSTSATCNTGDQIYCGGSWQGLINKLDYVSTLILHKDTTPANGSPLSDSKYGIHCCMFTM
jgi:alpha-amylase